MANPNSAFPSHTHTHTEEALQIKPEKALLRNYLRKKDTHTHTEEALPRNPEKVLVRKTAKSLLRNSLRSFTERKPEKALLRNYLRKKAIPN